MEQTLDIRNYISTTEQRFHTYKSCCISGKLQPVGTPPGRIALASDFAVDDVVDQTCVRVDDFVWSRLLDMQGLGLADPYGSAFAANDLVDEARGRADGLFDLRRSQRLGLLRLGYDVFSSGLRISDAIFSRRVIVCG